MHKKHDQSISKQQKINLSPSDETQYSKGVLTFCKNISRRQIINIQTHQSTRKLVNSNLWQLQHGLYEQASQNQLFSVISQVRIQKLNLGKNRKPNMIRQIKEVSFPFLTKLLLNDNHIISVQFLDHIDCPSLQSLALMNNKITHIRSFKKTRFPNLYYINLEKNFIQDFSHLVLAQTKNFNQLIIQTDKLIFYLNFSKDKVLSQNLNWLSKIKSNQIKQIWCQSANRIQNTKIKKMLLNKLNSVNFRLYNINQRN